MFLKENEKPLILKFEGKAENVYYRETNKMFASTQWVAYSIDNVAQIHSILQKAAETIARMCIEHQTSIAFVCTNFHAFIEIRALRYVQIVPWRAEERSSIQLSEV